VVFGLVQPWRSSRVATHGPRVPLLAWERRREERQALRDRRPAFELSVRCNEGLGGQSQTLQGSPMTSDRSCAATTRGRPKKSVSKTS
jgi:hypothetical protein